MLSWQNGIVRSALFIMAERGKSAFDVVLSRSDNAAKLALHRLNDNRIILKKA